MTKEEKDIHRAAWATIIIFGLVVFAVRVLPYVFLFTLLFFGVACGILINELYHHVQ